MVLRYAVLGQDGAHAGIIAAFTDLIDPAGSKPQFGRHEQQVFHCCGAVNKGVVLIALVGNDDIDRSAVEVVVRAAVVRLSNSFGKLQ